MKVNRTSIAARTGVTRPTKQRAMVGRAVRSLRAEACTPEGIMGMARTYRVPSGQIVTRSTNDTSLSDETDVPRYSRRDRHTHAATSHAHVVARLTWRRACDDR